ncbi:MAG: DUF465 domain-containing protein [Nitrospiraceae bacterium]|nr:DUF465 domain-containing protein [Nitrospiraceae bacterium]
MRDEQIAEILTRENDEFKKLASEHRRLDSRITNFSVKHYLNAEEELERKRIQKLKLLKKDQMEELIIRYKKDHSIN